MTQKCSAEIKKGNKLNRNRFSAAEENKSWDITTVLHMN